MRTGSHEYANEADDDDVPKPAQSLGTPVPRQKLILLLFILAHQLVLYALALLFLLIQRMPSTVIQSSLPFVSYSIYIHIYTHITNALFIETILLQWQCNGRVIATSSPSPRIVL